MKEIRPREFQNKFWSLVKGIERLRVVKRDGEFLGVWVPAEIWEQERTQCVDKGVEKPITHNAVQTDEKRSAFQELKEELDVRTMTEDFEEPPLENCVVCSNEPAEYEGVSEDLGGEWVQMKICGTCYRKKKPKGYKLIT